MLTKHVVQQIEAYLDHQLSLEERRLVEEHLAVCLTCRHHLLEARHLAAELGPLMQASLGRPAPPPALRQRVRQTLEATQTSSRPSFDWLMPGRLLNAVGTATVIALLAFSALTVIQGQLPEANVLSKISLLQSGSEGDQAGGTAPHTPAMQPSPTPTPTLKRFSIGDTLPQPLPLAVHRPTEAESTPTPLPPAPEVRVAEHAAQPTLEPLPTPQPPTGLIAFAFFNPAPQRQVYEIHLLNPTGTDHHLFPLDGVSEPALRFTGGGYLLAYRAWSEPTSPRSLLSSNLAGDQPKSIGGFWEDAQPDWSPTEDRIIFASQREMDRHWRLYTSWGDGSTEVNLRREGKSPTFAPDGHRFAFESCDNTGNHCGLWVGNLAQSEYESEPVLEDPLAKSPDWSPVAEQLAYMANPDDNWDLYLVNSDGSNVRRLTTDPAIDGLPTWSPDGKWLAFLSNRAGNWGIWLLHLESGQLQQNFSFDGGTFTPPSRSPYGERQWWDEQLSWSQ